MSINTISPSTSTTAVLIADSYVAPGGSQDSIPTMTKVGDETVSAALEVQSTEGGILFPRLSQDEIDDMVVTNGIALYNVDDGVFNFYQNGGWSGNGDVVGPNGSIVDNIATFANTTGKLIQDSGVSITQVPTLLKNTETEGVKAPLAVVNQISNLGFIQFTNSVGSVFVDSLTAVQFIENDFGPDSQVCTLITGELPSSSTTPSALLELKSTTGAFLLSRMTTVQISALTSPTNGMMVYDNTTNGYKLRQSSSWTAPVTAKNTGTNKTSGVVTLNGQSGVTVSTTAAILDKAYVLVSHFQGLAVANQSTLGVLSVGGYVDGNSFRIFSSNLLDTNDAFWQIVTPSAI
jgi:hypothetical protein